MTLRLNGSSSGFTELDAPAAAGSNTITLPTSNGSAEQFLKNSGTAGELEFSSMVETRTGIGIGTSAPSELLHIAGATNPAITLQDTTNNTDARIKTNNNGDLVFEADYNNEQSDTRIGFELDGSEKARIDSSGRLLLNKTGSPSAGEGSEAPVFIQGNTTNASGPAVLGLARGQSASAMSNGASLGIITFTDEDGNDFAQVKGACDGSAGTDDHPGRITFLTTPDGSSSLTERLRIDSEGISEFKSTNHVLAATTTFGAGTSKYLYRGHHSNGSTIVFNVWSNGNVESATNSYGGISDVKLKENIVDANSQWDDLKAIQVRNYNFKESTGQETHRQLGVIAQELETVSPGLVSSSPDLDADGNDLGTVTKSVNYSVLYMKAVKALQEAQTRIETLETKVAAIEAAE